MHRKNMARAMGFIHTHWRKGKTLKEIAERYGVDAGNLERAFRRREGVTIKQFIDRQRKDYLLSRLGDPALYGYEIGAAMGFSNKRAFYRWVERAFGVSFAKLRKRAKRKARGA